MLWTRLLQLRYPSPFVVDILLNLTPSRRTNITIAYRLYTIKDADIIHIMGEGLVLESGTHHWHDLIQAGGAYTRLMQSQNLHEKREGIESSDVLNSDNSTSIEELGHSIVCIEKEIHEKIPVGRKNTEHSLASKVLEQKKEAMGENETEKDYDLQANVSYYA